eukprot:CAMPEP_0177689058 /NCGR_PEP_ID=MMETSP0447-20121125/34972_1 /TAXON_ID=0 /ORGANISM="Stygamoeba regulata, Strain BSH-02190019" /LENGTH=479 /DNA_ID=CAMNT_0019199367 /DNA_START=114 /DNA_END=1553 /DNA_ORIENTATION=-
MSATECSYTAYRIQPDWLETLTTTTSITSTEIALSSPGAGFWLEQVDSSSGARQFEAQLTLTTGTGEGCTPQPELELAVQLLPASSASSPSASSPSASSILPPRAFFSAARRRVRLCDPADSSADRTRVAEFRAPDYMHLVKPTGSVRSFCSLEVTRRGDVAVCATEQGDVQVFGLGQAAIGAGQVAPTAGETLRSFIAPHNTMGVYVARLFPSERVLLTAGGDMRLCIWSLEDAQTERAAATLSGHCGGVLSADFVQRGRQLISSARDGTVRLWEVPTQQNSATVCLPATAAGTEVAHLAVNHCLLMGAPAPSPLPSDSSQPESVAAPPSLCALAVAENGLLVELDLRQPPTQAARQLHRYDSALNRVASLSQGGLDAGSLPACVCAAAEDGALLWVDRRRPNQWLRQLRVSASPLRQLTSSHYATGDGYVATLPDLFAADDPIFFTGAPPDPVYFCCSETSLFSVSQHENAIRQYHC